MKSMESSILSFMKQKGFAPILIILLVAVLGIGGYFGYTSLRGILSGVEGDVAISLSANPTPTQDPTANWKTYINTKYGFSIKYPSEWFIKDMTNTINASNILDAQYLNDKAEVDLQSYIVSLTIQNINLERAKFFLNYGDAGMQNESEITNIKVDNKDALKAITTFSQLDHKTNQYIEERDKTYRILIPLGNATLYISSKLNSQGIVNQILSTFRFD